MALQLDLYGWQTPQVLCLVSKPDLVVIEVEVDRNAVGQDILDKVCASIGTVEKDYFGLQYCGQRREPMWLNLRNRITGKLSGQSPFRLRLRVKYFVEPHFLLQESTRKLFYLQLKQDLVEGKLKISPEILPNVLAFAAQADYGDLTCNNVNPAAFETYTAIFPFNNNTSASLSVDLKSVWENHASLKGCTKSAAISKFLSEVSNLATYGTENYRLKLDVTASTQTTSVNQFGNSTSNRSTLINVTLRIGPRGVEIFDDDNEEIKRIPFKAIQLATNTGKLIDINVYQDDGSVKTMVFRALSDTSSNGLYRIITEMLAFYTWDTVHSSVIHQHCLDFKGHFLALFRPNDSDMGKQYVFDVQRTSREAYDNARRVLYHKQKKLNDFSLSQKNALLEKKGNSQEAAADEVEVLKERLSAITDALTCNVCFDREIECAFVPCGHQVCCKECADRCQSCPVCRQSIEQILFVFLPIEREFVLSGKNRTDLPLPEASSTYTNNLSQDNTANSCNFQTVQVVT
ncbi:E3 ubiquitin-protein ligase MYLIP-like [Clavelina lepadiformis]|uniref:RING-type E3 ubiquitin transferase n=1 Tax=Clavelina lepadiformis TaxID=159417 RepID=A0ABP0G0H8_CLALP